MIEILIFTRYLLIFAFGASIASFFNAQIYRLEKGYRTSELSKKPSFCEGCKRPLRWYELIPVVSYLLERGKCRTCGYKVPVRYPLTELALGVSFLILFLGDHLLIDYFLVSAVAFLALYDLWVKGFPKVVIHLYLGFAAFYWTFSLLMEKFQLFESGLVLALVIAALVSLLNLLKKSFGMGDVLLVVFFGLMLNLNQLIALLFTAVVVAGSFSIVLLGFKKLTRKSYIPFVPFLYLGLLVALTFGADFVQRYFDSISQLW